MSSLLELTTPTRHGDGYRLDVPSGWRQGRGAYGGFVVASLVRAIEDAVGDPARVVRSVTAELPAPVAAGDAELRVEILRAGNNVTTARADLRQDGEIRAHAVAILAAPRPSASNIGWQQLTPPEVPHWKTLAPIPASPMFPEFAQHFEYRLVEGVPTTGAPPRALGWIRSRLPVGKSDAAYLAAMADTWFPSTLVHLTQMRPMATIAFTLELVGAPIALPDEIPLLYRANAPVLVDGYSLETRELWTEDGRLLARNHQTFAVIA